MPKFKNSPEAVVALVKRYEVAKQHRSSWESHWKECYEYALPQREVFDQYTEGAKKNTKIYDSTALIGTQRFASRLQSTLVPPFKKWAKLSAGTGIPPELANKIDKQLEVVTDTLFSFLNQSNLATEAHEAFLDLAVGTGALLLDEGEGDDLLKFTAVPLKELLVEDGPHGTIETVFRLHEHPARNIKQVWKKGKCSAAVEEMMQSKPDELVPIIEATVYNPDKKLYEYVIIEEGTKHVIFEDYFEVSPWIVFRWSKVAGERYGRGPVMTALPDIKTANQVVKFVLKNAEKEIVGVYTAVDDGVLNPWTVNIKSGAVIPVAAEGSLSPLQSGGNFNVSELILQDLRENIKKALFHDQLGPMEGPTKSATEVSIRQQELMSDIGSSFGRLQMEFINKLIKRAIDILQRNQKVAPIKVGNQEVEIKVISPLAQQQDMDEVNKLAQFVQFASMVGEDALRVGLDLEAFPEHIAKLLGVDPDLVRDKEEREAMKQQMQQEAEMAQAAEAAAQNPEMAQQVMGQMSA
tara:strand:+ start:889 stop:2454 length:1566 start_codon:yes stop_codon:yes gene_type:complete